MTTADSSNPWWPVFEEAVKRAGGKLGKPEIFPASTDARYFRELGIPAFGFSPMANTPILLHDHNEVCVTKLLLIYQVTEKFFSFCLLDRITLEL
jgi:acetylornithine deacetylase/succinyl-diaminopimelate desuccinylase-like protein